MVVAACHGGPDLTPGAHLECAETAYDFGHVNEGDVLRHRFHLRNAGAAPLRIERVDPAYSCAPAVPVDTLAPGASADLEVACPTDGRETRLADVLVLRSNDADGRVVRLELSATMQPRLSLSSRTVDLEGSLGAPATAEVQLTGSLAAQARLGVLAVQPPGPEVSFPPAQGSEAPRVRLTYVGRAVGEGSGQVRLATGLPKPAELTLLYTWRVPSNLTVEPTNPFLDLRAPGAQEVIVHVASRRPYFRLNRAVVSAGPFAASAVQADDAGAGFVVRVRVDPGHVSGDPRGLVGTLRLLSNDPAEPARDVPLFALGPVGSGNR